MLFYEDFTKKIKDFFELDYKFLSPLTLVVNARDKFFWNYFHKSEFPIGIADRVIDSECKFGYSRDTVNGSLGISRLKLDMDLDYVPKDWLPKGQYLGFKVSNSILPRVINPAAILAKERNLSWGFDGSFETRVAFTPEMGHTFKFLCDEIHYIPRIGFSTLFNRKPFLFGINYIFDRTAPNYTGPFEVLLGATPINGVTTYVRHEATNFEFPGKVTLGVYSRAIFEAILDKMKKNDVKPKVTSMPTEFIAEGGANFKKEGTEFDGRAGVRITAGKRYMVQAKFDSNFKLGASFAYLPKKWIKLIWSMQFDTKKFVTHPTEGVDYLGGFSLEFDFSP